ncbi:glycosyltransferase family 87 protein [Alienimonas sp. DA493]|uniref:glycosyltransferase family 87 protein n=1 Tax=Alienimonas sp. DA493 TaxID=3373605 RepID=UPI003755311D
MTASPAPGAPGSPAADPDRPRWFETPRFRTGVLTFVAILCAVEFVYAVFKRENDYRVYLNFGADFLAGEPYRSPGNFYPLARCAFQGAIAALPVRVGKALVYSAALLTVWATWRVWERLAERQDGPLAPPRRFAAAALAGAVLFPFLLRDLDECGLQLLCLGMLTAAGAAIARGRAWLGGLWLAAAISFRVTPLLFLPLLVWKREWQAAAATVVGLIALNLAPALYLGWDEAVEQNKAWVTHVTTVLGDSPDAYPSPGEIEAPKHQNVGLRAALARLLETYEPGHPLYLDHPLFVQFGDLDAPTARKAIYAVILAMGAAVAWRMRRPWRTTWPPALSSESHDPFARDWAVACLFAALLSPVCWKHHTVLALPVVFLAGRRLVAGAETRGRTVAFWLSAAAIWGGRKFLLGDDLALVWLSYNFDTLALLTFGALCLYAPKNPRNAEAPRGLSVPAETA